MRTQAILVSSLALLLASESVRIAPAAHAQAGPRPRVIVSTDIGGTDPDDFQSMVHFLVYADMFDVEGLISSPYGPGRREHILQVIDKYAADYPNLRTYSARYPTPDELRRVTKQGAIDSAGSQGFGQPTEGSEWIVRAARASDARPLWVLVWGGIDDLAQALHDAPDILPKLRVYFIGGPNKMWSVDAYNYIEQHHPALWMIEANATYRGWFTGGNQAGEWGNKAFAPAHVAGRGALGEFFADSARGHDQDGRQPVGRLSAARHAGRPVTARMGRTIRPRLGRPQDGVRPSDDRSGPGRSVRRRRVHAAGACRHDTVAQSARMIFDGRIPAVGTREGGVLRFRFSPRDAKVWPYVIRSDFPGLDGQSGSFTAVPPPAERTSSAFGRAPQLVD